MQKSERIKKQTPTSQEVSKGLSEKGFLPKKMPESLELGESAEISSDREDELEAIMLIKARYAAGDYRTSLVLLEKYLAKTGHSKKFRDWLQKQLGVVLTSSAWLSLKTGRCEQAIEDFHRAIEIDANNRAVASGLAYCYQHLRVFEQAKIQWEQHLKNNPTDVQALQMYADVLESSLEYDMAVTALEQAFSLSEGDEKVNILKKLKIMRKKAVEGQFQQMSTSRHFNLLFRGDISAELGAWVLETLELALEQLLEEYGMKEPHGLLEVILYPQETFSDLMEGSPHWIGGVFDGRIKIPLNMQGVSGESFWQRLKITLRHELVHAILSSMSGRRSLPPWFDEGLAQRFTCQGQSCNVIKRSVTPGGFLSKKDFESSFVSYDQVKARRVYDQSLYLILVLESLDRQSVRLIVEQITPQGVLSSDSLLKPLGMDFSLLLGKAKESWTIREIFNSSN